MVSNWEIDGRPEEIKSPACHVTGRLHLPRFKNEDAEGMFWATHDSTAYLDWRGTRAILPNLKPTPQTISLRLPKPSD